MFKYIETAGKMRVVIAINIDSDGYIFRLLSDYAGERNKSSKGTKHLE